MKKILISLLVVLLCAVGIMTLNFYSNVGVEDIPSPTIYEPKAPLSHPEIIVDTSLPTVPEKVKVYKVIEPDAKKEISDIMKIFNVDGNIEETDDAFMVKDKQFEIEVLKSSGRIRCLSYSAFTADNLVKKLPEEEDAKKIAVDFLNTNGLMPKDAKFDKIVIDKIIQANKDPETGKISEEEFPQYIQVIFKRVIDNIPVDGPGEKLKVYIGDNGKIIGVYKCWRTYKPYAETKIISPSEALKNLKERGIYGVKVGKNVKVIDMYLSYYAQPAVDKQDYLQPVYVFTVETENKDVFKQYIPAIPGKDITHPKTESQQQPYTQQGKEL